MRGVSRERLNRVPAMVPRETDKGSRSRTRDGSPGLSLLLAYMLAAAALGTLVGVPRAGQSLTPHSTIWIFQDADFDAAHGVVGGSGSAADPYVIEGWDIDGSAVYGYAGGIWIRDTTAHYVVRNNSVHDLGMNAPPCDPGWCGIGVLVGPSAPHGRVEGNTFTKGIAGVVVDRSQDISVVRNSESGSTEDGFGVIGSSDVALTDNYASASGWTGVSIGSSANVTLARNLMTGSSRANTGNGVEIWDSRSVTVVANTIQDHLGVGLSVGNSTGVLVFGNYFLSNAIQAADSGGAENRWDGGCAGGGNFWSDYNGSDDGDCATGGSSPDGRGDSPYILDANSRDRYPLVVSSRAFPVSPYWHNVPTIDVRAELRNPLGGALPLTLWSRHSADNTTWDPWAPFTTLYAPPWGWTYPFYFGEGYYEFRTEATGYMSRAEPPPASPDAVAGYDATPPASGANPIAPYWNSSPIMIEATASDTLSGVANVTLRYSFATDNATWGAWTPYGTDSAAPWSWTFSFSNGTGHYRFHSVARDVAGNMEGNKAIEAIAGYRSPTPVPVTRLVVGAPNYTASVTYVTSATPLSFSVLDRSGMGIRSTMYRVDGGPWVNYTATGPFALSGEGAHVVEWSSTDFAGNVEPAANAVFRIDNTPPTTILTIGAPQYVAADTFVTSASTITLAATDGGVTPVGVAATEYRIDGGAWTPSATAFALATEGRHTIDYRSTDRLGNAEVMRTATLVVDVTPPVTTISPAVGPFAAGTNFTLAATDDGSGVARTEYRIDGGPWIPYNGGFSLPAGDHAIRYRSADHVNNTEAERTLAMTVTTPPPTAEANRKPLVAATFAAALAIAGAWASRKRPWKGAPRRRAVLAAFAATTLPFVVAEAATGIVSLLTGLLSIPPILGVGTAVDMGILIGGMALLTYSVRRRTPPK